MTSTTTSAWSSLFHGLPSTNPASQPYTEEAIDNAQLPADQLIEKALGNAEILFAMVSSLSEEHETLHSFEQNDVIQTVFQECQEMSNYLSERIWDDSGDSGHQYQTFDSTSSSSQPKTADEEAQISVLLVCNEKIQTALHRYNELKDFLTAKDLQDEEVARDRAYRSTHPIGDFPSITAHHIDGSSTFAAAAAALGDDRIGDYDEDEEILHVRRSEQPLVWKLDPRADFKANQQKMKTGKSQEELSRLTRERGMERKAERHPLNGVHGMSEDPMKIPPEMLIVDEVNEEEVAAAAEAVRATTPIVEVDEDGLERINNHPQVEEVEDDDEEEKVQAKEEDDNGSLSDDSWEEIPELGIVSLSIEDEVEAVQEEEVDMTSTVSSATSSFLITPAEASSRVPTVPSANIREL